MNFWIEIRPVPDIEGASRRDRRMAETAAWRAIVRERLGSGIGISYDNNGAPLLDRTPDADALPAGHPGRHGHISHPGHPGHISVSHTKGWVAVLWSPEPCAIDIEPVERELPPAAAARYSIGSISDWCALEAAYKYKSVSGREPDPARLRFHPHPHLVVAVIL